MSCMMMVLQSWQPVIPCTKPIPWQRPWLSLLQINVFNKAAVLFMVLEDVTQPKKERKTFNIQMWIKGYTMQNLKMLKMKGFVFKYVMR